MHPHDHRLKAGDGFDDLGESLPSRGGFFPPSIASKRPKDDRCFMGAAFEGHGIPIRRGGGPPVGDVLLEASLIQREFPPLGLVNDLEFIGVSRKDLHPFFPVGSNALHQFLRPNLPRADQRDSRRVEHDLLFGDLIGAIFQTDQHPRGVESDSRTDESIGETVVEMVVGEFHLRMVMLFGNLAQRGDQTIDVLFFRADRENAQNGIGLRQFELDFVFRHAELVQLESVDVEAIQGDDQLRTVEVKAAMGQEMAFPAYAEARNPIDLRFRVFRQFVCFLLGLLPFGGHELPRPIQRGDQ